MQVFPLSSFLRNCVALVFPCTTGSTAVERGEGGGRERGEGGGREKIVEERGERRERRGEKEERGEGREKRGRERGRKKRGRREKEEREERGERTNRGRKREEGKAKYYKEGESVIIKECVKGKLKARKGRERGVKEN